MAVPIENLLQEQYKYYTGTSKMTVVEFEKLNKLYSAIKDIDRILISNSEDKIDDVINVVKDINKKEFDSEFEFDIIIGFRNAIKKIYDDTFLDLNASISDNVVKMIADASNNCTETE